MKSMIITFFIKKGNRGNILYFITTLPIKLRQQINVINQRLKCATDFSPNPGKAGGGSHLSPGLNTRLSQPDVLERHLPDIFEGGREES